MSYIVWLVTLITALLGSCPAYAEVEGVYTIAQFKFGSGATMDGLRVGYVTYGKVNADRSNVVLLVPRRVADGTGRTAISGRAGPMTPTSIFAIGTGTSSQPRDELELNFPAYTIRDMVRAEYEMVNRGLGLASLRAIAGPQWVRSRRSNGGSPIQGS